MIGDSFLTDRNFKMRIRENLREEARPCPDHIFLIHESVQLPDHAGAKKHLGSQGRVMQTNARLPTGSLVDSILAKRCLSIHGSDLGWPQPAIAWSRA